VLSSADTCLSLGRLFVLRCHTQVVGEASCVKRSSVLAVGILDGFFSFRNGGRSQCVHLKISWHCGIAKSTDGLVPPDCSVHQTSIVAVYTSRNIC
jgi:hypothetical protein